MSITDSRLLETGSGVFKLESGGYRIVEGAAPAGLVSGALSNWDAEDAGAFTYSSGVSVTAWANADHTKTLVPLSGPDEPDRSGLINGHTAVSFDGGSWIICQPQALAEPVTLHAVFAFNANAPGTESWAFNFGAEIMRNDFFGSTNLALRTQGGSYKVIPFDQSPHLLTWVINSAGSGNEQRVDGVQVGTNVLGAFTPATDVRMGMPGGKPVMTVGQWVIYDRVLTPTEIAQNETYLMSKWSPSSSWTTWAATANKPTVVDADSATWSGAWADGTAWAVNLADSVTGNDMYVEADVTFPSGTDWRVGVVARAGGTGTGDEKGYAFMIESWQSNWAQTWRFGGGGWAEYFGPNTWRPGALPTGTHKMGVKVVGNIVSVYFDGVFVGSNTDTLNACTTGTRGGVVAMGTVNAVAWNNLTVEPSVFTDNFNRADTTTQETPGVGLGAEWNGPSWRIESNVAHKTGGFDFAAFLHDIGTPDMWVEADITPNAFGGGANGGYGCLDVRTGPALPGCLLGFWAPDFRWVIGSTVGGYHDLNWVSSGSTPTFPLHLRFEVEGTALRLYVNNVLTVSTTSTEAAANTYAGMNAGTEVGVDNYRCGPLPYTP